MMMTITSIIAEQHGETKCVGSEESRHTHFDNRGVRPETVVVRDHMVLGELDKKARREIISI